MRNHSRLRDEDLENKYKLLGGGGKSGGGGTSTTTQSIPEELKPLATQYTSKAIDLSNTPYNGYQGQRYADLNQEQQTGINMVANRAQNGSQTLDNAEGNLNQLIGGGKNPYLDAAYGQAAEQVSNSVNSQFSGAGRYGSGAQQDLLAKNLGNVATNIYGGAYDQDQGRRLQAIGLAPQYGQLEYQDASQLLNAGQILQDQEQKNKDYGYQQFQEQENDPYKKLAAMAAVFGTNLGGTSKTESSNSGGGGK